MTLLYERLYYRALHWLQVSVNLRTRRRAWAEMSGWSVQVRSVVIH